MKFFPHSFFTSLAAVLLAASQALALPLVSNPPAPQQFDCWQCREYITILNETYFNTGLYYFRNRWYDPVSGRFLSKDPIGLDGGDLNLYAFCGNDPVNYRDPYGLSQNSAEWYFAERQRQAQQDIDLSIASAQAFNNNNTLIGGKTGGQRFRPPPHLPPSSASFADRLRKLGSFFSGFRKGCEKGSVDTRLVIGRGEDLAKPGALGSGEYKLSWPPNLTARIVYGRQVAAMPSRISESSH